jgi:transposase
MLSSRKTVKLQALRQNGTLHLHPETVTDPLFQNSDFFDPRDLVQVKYEMLRRALIDKASITDAASAFGFSRPSFYQAQAALAQHGLTGLIPHKTGPQGAHKMNSQVMAFVGEIRDADPSLAVAHLIERIQQRFGITVHRRTIQRHLQPQEKKTRRR